MEYEDYDMENLVEQEQEGEHPELIWDSDDDSLDEDDIPSRMSTSDDDSDLTESSDDEDEDKREPLQLLSLHTQYHLPETVRLGNDDDTPRRGFQNDCPFCQCSLFGILDEPGPSMSVSSFGSFASSPDSSRSWSPWPSTSGSLMPYPVLSPASPSPSLDPGSPGSSMPPSPIHSSLGGDLEAHEDFLEDYFEEMDIEDEMLEIETVDLKFLYRLEVTVSCTSRSI